MANLSVPCRAEISCQAKDGGRAEMKRQEDEDLGLSAEDGITLDAMTRERRGRQMRERYEPVIDEPLDPRLAELLAALAQAKDPDC